MRSSLCIEKKCLDGQWAIVKWQGKFMTEKYGVKIEKILFSVLFLCFLILKKLSFLLFDSKSLPVSRAGKKSVPKRQSKSQVSYSKNLPPWNSTKRLIIKVWRVKWGFLYYFYIYMHTFYVLYKIYNPFLRKAFQ